MIVYELYVVNYFIAHTHCSACIPKCLQADRTQMYCYFIYLDLPDEILVKIFKYTSVEMIMISLCQVCKRWKIICETDCLWKIIPIDEWMISNIREGPLATLMSHSSAFCYFSMRNVLVDNFSVALLSQLAHSSKLVYLDLSGQHLLRNVEFLCKRPSNSLEYLFLENCSHLSEKSVIEAVKHLTKLKMLSIDGLALSQENQFAIAQLQAPGIFNLGLGGSVLTIEITEMILQNFSKMIFLKLSCKPRDKLFLMRLCLDYDVNVTFV